MRGSSGGVKSMKTIVVVLGIIVGIGVGGSRWGRLGWGLKVDCGWANERICWIASVGVESWRWEGYEWWLW
jgi:hypothetical protein